MEEKEEKKEQGQMLDIEQLLKEGRVLQLKPQGYSMYPLFVPGRDEARIAPIGTHTLKRGDVVLYRRDHSILVLHRIVKKNASGIYLVGDNQAEIEGPLREDQMKGILIGLVRKGNYVPVSNPLYRLYASVWLALRPLRPPISRTIAKLKRLGRKIKK